MKTLAKTGKDHEERRQNENSLLKLLYMGIQKPKFLSKLYKLMQIFSH